MLALRARVLARELTWDDEAFLRWRYFSEPAAAAPDNRLFLVRGKEGEVLGSLGIEPQRLHLNGEVIPAARFMDIMVDPRVHGMGLGAWMNLALQDRNDVGLAIGATNDSYNLVRRVFQPLPERHSWKLLVRSHDFLARRTPRLAEVPGIARGADALLGAGRIALALGFSIGLEIDRLHGLGREEGAIADMDRSMARSGFTFSQRTAGYLAWRYLANPRRRYQIWGARRRGKLVGLLVSRSVAERGELVDWMWDADQPESERIRVLCALFASAIDHLARQGAVTVWLRTLGSPGEAAASRVGMRQRQERDTVAFAAREPGRARELGQARWFLTLGDSDDD